MSATKVRLQEVSRDGDPNAVMRADFKAKQERRARRDKLYEVKDGRPTIQLHARSFEKTAKLSEQAIMRRGAEVFSRGERLVRPVTKDARGANGTRTKVTQLANITLPYMRQWMDRSAVYERPGPENGPEWVPTPPPKEIAELILARLGDWLFPEVVGIIAAPTLRPDGTLLDKPGYDADTRLFLTPGLTLPRMPARPTREQALAALNMLKHLLREFPFEDESSRAVALSGLITPVVRGMLAHAPIHGFTAPTPGTGKSYLVDTSSAIATGFRAEALSVGKNEEETEKRLDGALLAGGPILNLDNVNGPFSSEKLCQMATAESVTVRALGTSNLVKIETTATIFLNGNNFGLSVELARRTLLSRLDAVMEKLHERKFEGNPVAEVMANRAGFVAAALTIVRAYIAEGRPDKLPGIASFKDWSDNVRSALVWLGCADPAATLDKARDDSPELADATAIFEAWEQAIGCDVQLTAAQLQTRVSSIIHQDARNETLREALLVVAGNRGDIIPERLGKWLRENRGRVIGGRRLMRSNSMSSGKYRWFLQRI